VAEAQAALHVRGVIERLAHERARMGVQGSQLRDQPLASIGLADLALDPLG
jgi:hypothetical protein